MAEVLGAVASAAQLVQFSAQILSSGYAFLSKAAKAPSEVRQLLTETAALDCVLDRLQRIPQPMTPTTSPPAQYDDPIAALHKSGIFKECTELLVYVQKALDSFVEVDRQRVANLAKRLAWPLREKEVTDALQRLSRIRGIISTAIEASSAQALSRVELTQTKLLDMVTGLKTHLSSQRDGERLKEVASWLCSSPGREREKTLQRNLALRLPGSGKWLLGSKWYTSWKQDPRDHLIWINGLAGEGKSVLFSSIVQDLQSTNTVDLPGHVLLYHFCTSDNETYNQSPTLRFLEDLSVQFVVCSEACHQIASEMWKRKGGSPLETSEYLALLSSFIAKCSRIYLLVDALDETGWQDSRETRTFLETMTQLLGGAEPLDKAVIEGSNQRTKATWKLLLSSRMDSLISRWTESWRRGPAEVVRLSAHTKPDLRHFVSAEVSRRLKAGSLRLRNEALERDIVFEITRHAGTFLHATLQLDSVTNTRSDKEVKAVLRSLTSGLDVTYGQIMTTAARRFPKRIEEMKEILELLVVVDHFSCSALAEQVSIAPGDTCLDLDSIVTDPEDILTPLSQVVYISRSISGQSSVGLLHFTVREFLTSGVANTQGEAAQFHINLEDAHTRLLGKYLQYLAFSDFDDTEGTASVPKYGFLFRHAAHAWPHHLRSSRVWERSPSHFRDQILPYLDWFTAGDANNSRFRLWRTIQSIFSDDPGTESVSPAYLHCSHPLAFSIAQGLDCLVDIILPRFGATGEGALDVHFADGFTCLSTAACRNHVKLARRLLDAGAGIDVPTKGRKLTALHIAAERGFEEMATLLVHAGASLRARSSSGSTPFYRAARGGSEHILRLLHAAGSEVDAFTWDGWTPLMEAVEHSNDKAVELLLAWGADPTNESTYGTTSLELARDVGLERMIEAAIERWKTGEGRPRPRPRTPPSSN